MSPEEPLKRLAGDFLNLLVNGQAFSDVAFTVEGRHVYAHKCILAARSRFFRMVFSSNGNGGATAAGTTPIVIPVAVVGHDVFMLMLQFLYSGQLSLVPPQPLGCKESSCWHAHCRSAVNFALEALHAAQIFGIEELSILVQKELALMAEKASIEDAMRILVTARKQDLFQLWSVCSKLIAKSGLSFEALDKHLPAEIAAEIEAIRQKCGYYCGSKSAASEDAVEDQRTRRMQKALDSSDVELVKLMVMEEGLNLDKAFALHYAVANCSRKVVRMLLELEAADVNAFSVDGKTPLHIACQLADPEMIAVLLDHHANPHLRAAQGSTAVDFIHRHACEALTVESVTGVVADHSKLKLCLDLLQSAESSATPNTRLDEERSCLVLPDHHQNQQQQQQQNSENIQMHANLMDFYPVDISKDHSPAWSDKAEVIDPIRIVPAPEQLLDESPGPGYMPLNSQQQMQLSMPSAAVAGDAPCSTGTA